MEQFIELLGKENPILKSINDRGFEIPTEIQEKSIPEILKEKDVIAGASTGSGKTLAFAAGLIRNIKKDYGVQGLVLTPTRELAEQVANEISDFSQDKDLNVISIYGGVSITDQIRRLTSAEIVVGTPGRILDHINRNSINLSLVNTLVLDEADRMLDMGFRDDVEKIIANCPNKRQTMLFSATISQDIVLLAQKYMKNPIEISAKPHVDPEKLEQIYYDVEDNLKYSLLKHLLENEKSKLAIIFCNTRKNVDFVANNLKFMGIEALPIHGGFSQEKRTRILKSFHLNENHILIATDVAARGLDIKGVSHIYNYDIPLSKEEYVHRIGRTARAGKDGKVINLLTSRNYENFQNLMTGEFKIVQKTPPFIKRARIRWMPEKRSERTYRRNNNQSKFSNDRGDRRFSNNSNRSFNDQRSGRFNNNRGDRRFNNDRGNKRFDNQSNNQRDRRFGNRNSQNNNRGFNKRKFK